MRALNTRDHRRGRSISSGESRFYLEVQMLAMQTETRSPLVPSAPVSPKQRSRSHRQGMEQDAHLARFGRCVSTPLALLTQRTGTAVANADGIDDSEIAITLSTLFMRDQYVACWTAQGPVGLKGKVGSWKASRFPGGGGGGWRIPRSRSRRDWRCGGVLLLRGKGRRKLGGAQRFRGEFVSQLQAEVPGPLSHDLPGFLSPDRVATPAIRLLFDVFVFQGRFKGTTV